MQFFILSCFGQSNKSPDGYLTSSTTHTMWTQAMEASTLLMPTVVIKNLQGEMCCCSALTSHHSDRYMIGTLSTMPRGGEKTDKSFYPCLYLVLIQSPCWACLLLFSLLISLYLVPVRVINVSSNLPFHQRFCSDLSFPTYGIKNALRKLLLW